MKIDRREVVISSPPGTGVAMSASGPDRCTVIGGPLEAAGPLDASGPLEDEGMFAGSAGTALVILTTSVQPVPSSVTLRGEFKLLGRGGAGVTSVPLGTTPLPLTRVRTT